MLDLHILIEREGDLYSALCLELNVASQGKTIKEAERNIREAVSLYLEDVYKSDDQKDFIPRSAPVQEWLKYFRKEAEKLGAEIKAGRIKPRLKEVVVG